MQFNFYDKFVSQKHVPEYVCNCCDQLWFKCSVVKCDPNKYKAYSPDIVQSCLTDFTSVDDTEWICTTCNSSLKIGRSPSCSKAKKMGFPYEPKIDDSPVHIYNPLWREKMRVRCLDLPIA